MRSKRSFIVLIAAGVAVVATLALPAAPAQAAESIGVSPNEVEVDEEVDVVGDGFTECHKVFIYLSNEPLGEGGVIGDLASYELLDITYTGCDPTPSDYFSMSLKIPDSLTAVSYTHLRAHET